MASAARPGSPLPPQLLWPRAHASGHQGRSPGPSPEMGARVPEGREKELGAGGLSCPDPGQRAVGSTLNTHSAPEVPSPLPCRPWAGHRADTARQAMQALIPQQPPNLRNKQQQRGGPQGSARSWRTVGAPPTPLGIRPPAGGGGREAVAPHASAAGALRPLPAQGPPQLYPEPPRRRPGSLFQPVLRGGGRAGGGRDAAGEGGALGAEHTHTASSNRPPSCP